jgi:hypothetical protein
VEYGEEDFNISQDVVCLPNESSPDFLVEEENEISSPLHPVTQFLHRATCGVQTVQVTTPGAMHRMRAG